jgi:hypothetical protein
MTQSRLRPISAATHDPEAVVRTLARAIIRRVQAENPGSSGPDLRALLVAANPFKLEDEAMCAIWVEEINWALESHTLLSD